jgi:hypothetical protein
MDPIAFETVGFVTLAIPNRKGEKTTLEVDLFDLYNRMYHKLQESQSNAGLVEALADAGFPDVSQATAVAVWNRLGKEVEEVKKKDLS